MTNFAVAGSLLLYVLSLQFELSAQRGYDWVHQSELRVGSVGELGQPSVEKKVLDLEVRSVGELGRLSVEKEMLDLEVNALIPY